MAAVVVRVVVTSERWRPHLCGPAEQLNESLSKLRRHEQKRLTLSCKPEQAQTPRAESTHTQFSAFGSLRSPERRAQADCGEDFEGLLAVLDQFVEIAQGEQLKGHFALGDFYLKIKRNEPEFE
jgi:hypothetical protein